MKILVKNDIGMVLHGKCLRYRESHVVSNLRQSFVSQEYFEGLKTGERPPGHLLVFKLMDNVTADCLRKFLVSLQLTMLSRNSQCNNQKMNCLGPLYP